MKIRKARKTDFSRIIRLAKNLDLDYDGMQNDSFWVAEEKGLLAGIIGLKKQGDCDELCSLGVDPHHQKQGLGRRLVERLTQNVHGDIFLATVIPGFFERCGFVKSQSVPAGMKKEPSWCKGCDKNLCTIMVRKGQ